MVFNINTVAEPEEKFEYYKRCAEVLAPLFYTVSDLPGGSEGLDPLASFFDPPASGFWPTPGGVGLTPSNLLPVISYTKRLNHNLDIGAYCRRVNNRVQ